MKTLRLYQIDAFTRERFHGNPAGVVANADGLSDDMMQRIARELNNSETAFIFSADSPDYDVEVRFFTPLAEVPLCGHATVSAHYVRAMEGLIPSGHTVQKTKAGILPVDIVYEDGEPAVVMTMGTPNVDEPISEEAVRKVAAALGLEREELRNDCPLAIASTGSRKLMVPIRTLERLNALEPDLKALAALSCELGCSGCYAFTFEADAPVPVHGRSFNPAAGIPEDPVTGVANAALGAYIVHYGLLPHDGKKLDFSIIQGEAIRRDGGMRVCVDIENNEAQTIRIIGNAVVAFKTEITV